jgi:hypothetical protein
MIALGPTGRRGDPSFLAQPVGGRLDLTIPKLIVFTVFGALICPPAQARYILAPRSSIHSRGASFGP